MSLDLFQNIGISSFLANYSCSVELYDIHTRNLFFPFSEEEEICNIALSFVVWVFCLRQSQRLLISLTATPWDLRFRVSALHFSPPHTAVLQSLQLWIWGMNHHVFAMCLTWMFICHVLDLDAVRMFGFDMDELVDLYYNCNGGRPRMVSPNCAKVGALSFSLPPSLSHFTNFTLISF